MGSIVNVLVFEHDLLENYPWLSDLIFSVLSIIYYLLGRMAFTQESVPLVVSFWTFSSVILVFIAYGFYSILSEDWGSIIFNINNLSFGLMFFVSGFFLIIIRILLIIQSIITYKYFGEGLAALEHKIEKYWDPDDNSAVNE